MADQTETVTEVAPVTDAKTEPQAANGKTLDEIRILLTNQQTAL